MAKSFAKLCPNPRPSEKNDDLARVIVFWKTGINELTTFDNVMMMDTGSETLWISMCDERFVQIPYENILYWFFEHYKDGKKQESNIPIYSKKLLGN